MINLPNRKELEELKNLDEPFCLTIYAPFIEPDKATNPNRIELKNLLTKARTALLSAGASHSVAEKTLAPALSMLDNHEFWPVQKESLAIFSHPKLFRLYHIPNHDTPHMLSVGTGFNLDHLLKLIKDNERYFLLALGHKDIRLYSGDHYRLRTVSLKKLPTDLKNALNIDEFPKWQETHTIAPASSGKGSEAFHGQYNIAQTDKEMLLEFFRKIDHNLRDFLNWYKKPLIIAGVGYLLPIYRQVNTYPGLLPEGIPGSQKHTDLEKLRDKAWKLLTLQKTIKHRL